jgi:hypothetical protein
MNEQVYIVVLGFFALAVYRVIAAKYRRTEEVHADGSETRVASRSSSGTPTL